MPCYTILKIYLEAGRLNLPDENLVNIAYVLAQKSQIVEIIPFAPLSTIQFSMAS